MLKPQEKTGSLINSLINTLRVGGGLGDQELVIFREIKQLNQESDLTDLVYALFYACKKDNANADKYFNRSIKNGLVICVSNYTTFLIKTRSIKKAIQIKNRFKNLLINNMDSQVMTNLWMISVVEGDFKTLQHCFTEAEKRKWDDIIDACDMKSMLSNYQLFKEAVNISEEQVSFILNTMIDVFENYNLGVMSVLQYSADIDNNINSLVMYVEPGNVEEIVNANFKLAEVFAKELQFIGKRFVPMFECTNEGNAFLRGMY